ncbi:MAG: DUF4173 domain-containing protein [Actinomycetota bacterium]|nr:DUF4173 domain-containing protein [Actinomycetota bacterium]
MAVGEWALDLGLDRPPDLTVVVTALAAGFALDGVVRSGVVGIAGAAGVALLAGALLASGRVRNPQAQALVAASVLFGGCLALRTSPGLVALDVAAAAGLLVAGASLAGGGSALDLSVPAVVNRGVHALAHGLAAASFLLRPLALPSGAGGPTAALAAVRGLTLALVLVVPLGLLLASADTVFASFFGGFDVGSLAQHGALITVGAWGMAGLLRLASARPVPPLPVPARRLPALEATVAVGALVALFVAFAVAQLVSLTEGGRHVIETAGLTYAEYARSGFFQLLAVSAITLAVLLGLRGVADLSEPVARRRFVVLAQVAAGLTLVIVFVAVRRLELYEHAFGMTMLRLYAQVFALWIGSVFLMLALLLAGVGGDRHRLPSAAAALGLATVLALNALNPEAVVVRHNVEAAARTSRFDAAYLVELSDDSVPALVGALPRLDQDSRRLVLDALCPASETPFRKWLAYNGARDRAAEARNQACPAL